MSFCSKTKEEKRDLKKSAEEKVRTWENDRLLIINPKSLQRNEEENISAWKDRSQIPKLSSHPLVRLKKEKT